MIIENPNWSEIRRLYDKLSDPFETMALQSVSYSLKQTAENTESYLSEQMGPYGIARKFWSVPMELAYEEKGYSVGNIFVLAQVSITQSTIIFQKLREYCNNKDCYPKKKQAILDFKSNIISNGNISEISLIDTVSNYFKHQDEWPSTWISPDEDKYPTMKRVKEIGMTPQLLTDNMEIALHTLGVSDDISLITNIVQVWRENLASELLRDSAIASVIREKV